MFNKRKQILNRLNELENLVFENISIRTPTWDYACSVCEYGIHCVDGSGKHVIACAKKLPKLCCDFSLEKSYQGETQ